MSRPVVLNPHGSRRASSRRVPRWLVLLVSGVAAGAGGLLFVQHRYLPPRLSAEESAHLTASFERADAERAQLRRALEQTTLQLDGVKAERQRLAQELQDGRHTVAQLREELAALVDALPPDPRGGAVQVRAARFSAAGGKLNYEVMLSREAKRAAPLQAVMQVVVAGAPKRGPEASVKLEPVALTMTSFESLRGGLALPEGFDPRQATVQVLDGPHGKLLGMRVLAVK